MLKVPHWEMMIVWYFFLGGVAGGAYFTAAIADNFGSATDRAVARAGYLLSLPLALACGLLLIADLGVPTRFLHMITDFKFWDPMSIGAWAVGLFGAFSFVSSVLSLSGSEASLALRRKISLVGIFFGFFLASYTGVLLSNSAMPFWRDARLMGALFLASGASTGIAAITLVLFVSGAAAGEGWGKLKHADRYSMVLELVLLLALVVLLGAAGQPLTSGHYATLFWGGLIGVGLVLPLVLDFVGQRARAVGALAATLVLIGGFVLRYVVLMSVQA
ncbi:MAG TPA: NrfD/PsrC family molybdoenzyme membrane anchor subunit [Methylomirabilota bacterium]|nr:NrfD/PsrC family molybdoenzyme membrane anchor subunit [Methylomirabilota bacterium]